MISFLKRHCLICLLVGFFPLHFSYAWQVYTAVEAGVHYKLVEKGDKAFVHLFTEQNDARLFLTYEKQGSSFNLVYSFLNTDKILFNARNDNCEYRQDSFRDLRALNRSLGVDRNLREDPSTIACSGSDESIFRAILNEREKILPLRDEQFKKCLMAFPATSNLEERIRVWNTRNDWTTGNSSPVKMACVSMPHQGVFLARPPTIGLSRELLATQDPSQIYPVLREELLHWLGFEDDRVIHECLIPKCFSGIADASVETCLSDKTKWETSDVKTELCKGEDGTGGGCVVVYSVQSGSPAAVANTQAPVVAQVPSSVQIAEAQASSLVSSSSRPLQGNSLLTVAVGAFRGQIAFANAGGANARVASGSVVQGSGSRGPAFVGRGNGGRAPLRNVTEPRSWSQQNFQAKIPSVEVTKFDSGYLGRRPASVEDSSAPAARQKQEVSSAESPSPGARVGGRSGSRLISGSATGAVRSSESTFDRLPQGLAASLPPTAEQLIRRLETTVQNSSLDRVEEQLNTLSDDLNEAGITVYTPGNGRRFGAPRGQVWFRIDSEGRLVDVTPRR